MPNYECGSIWRKWDLHVHSPLCGLNNNFPKLGDGTPDWDAYLTALEAITDVPVVGITDYFLIDGYKTVREYQRSGRLKKFDLVLPNIEFRIDKVLLSKQKRLTVHVIFSDDLTPEEIEDNFLSNLDVIIEGSPGSPDNKRKLRKSSLVELGKHLKAEHQPFQNRSDFEIGCTQAVVSLEQIVQLLSDMQLFRDRYLIGLADEYVSLIDWDAQDHNVRKLLLQRSHVVFTGNPKAVDWNLGRTYASVEDFVAEFKSQKASLFGSDAHETASICKPQHDKYTWIKADTTFEGLRQVLYEPELRAHIGSSPPKEKDSTKVITAVSLANSSGWFADFSFPLSRDLVAVIGGKGSGKTAFLDLLAFASDAMDVNNSASFLTKASHELKGTTVALLWGDGSCTGHPLPERLQKPSAEPKVRYLSQSFVESLCSFDQQEKLMGQIEDILFQYVPIAQQLGAKDFATLKRLKTQAIQMDLDATDDRLKQVNKQIVETERAIGEREKLESERVKLISDKHGLEEQRPIAASQEEAAVRERLRELRSKETETQRFIEDWNLKVNVLGILRSRAHALYESIRTFDEELADTVKRHSLGLDVDSISVRIPTGAMRAFDAATAACVTESQKLQVEGGEPTTLDTLPKIRAAITPLEKLVSSEAEKQRELQEIEKRIADVDRRIQITESAIARINADFVPLLDRLKTTRGDLFKNLWLQIEAKRAALEELYRPLSDAVRGKGERDKVSFYTRLVFRESRFAADGWVPFDGRKTTIRGEEALRELGAQFWAALSDQSRTDKGSVVLDFLAVSIEKGIPVGQQLRKGFGELDVYNWLYSGQYYDVEYGIRYEGTDLDKLSPGRKGVVLLLIYLDFDQDFRPLLIDQPEENLDNRSVFGTLVEYFRHAKRRRQVIIVTHNPNLVVNADAEQVVVANFEREPTTQNSRIAYVAGALENCRTKDPAVRSVLLQQGIRQHVCELLEGGDVAFVKREHRYGLA